MTLFLEWLPVLGQICGVVTGVCTFLSAAATILWKIAKPYITPFLDVPKAVSELAGKVQTVETKVDTVETKVDTLDTKVNTVDAKIKKLEIEIQAAAEKSSTVKALQDLVHTLKGEVGSLKLKMENHEETRKLEKAEFERQLKELLPSVR